MRIVEPHIHMYARVTDDYERMAISGIEAVVEPAFWSGLDRRYPESFFDYFAHLLKFESNRAAQYGIKYFCCIGVNPKEANDLDLSHKVIDGMKEYLDHEKTVAVGEIGFDKITDAEEEIFRRQLKLGDELEMPIVIHTPHQNKKVGTQRIIEIIKDEKVCQKRIVIDHNTEETIEISLATEAWAGLTIYPVTKLSPERATGIVRRYGVNRILINASADWGPSDPLSVPKTAHLMLQNGFSREQVEKLVFHNPIEFFSQSPKFSI